MIITKILTQVCWEDKADVESQIERDRYSERNRGTFWRRIKLDEKYKLTGKETIWRDTDKKKIGYNFAKKSDIYIKLVINNNILCKLYAKYLCLQVLRLSWKVPLKK